MRYDYDMLGTRIHQASMEAGERWMLNDVAGKPIRAWDSRGHQFRTSTTRCAGRSRSFVREGAGSPVAASSSTVYGEGQPDAGATQPARPGRISVFDQAGVVTNDDVRLQGQPAASSRQLAADYKATLDWSADPAARTGRRSPAAPRYDALNRPIDDRPTPDGSVIRPALQRGQSAGAGATSTCAARRPATPFVSDIDYDAKGQRERIEYGNGVTDRATTTTR